MTRHSMTCAMIAGPLIVLGTATSGEAAVRMCKPLVTSGLVVRPTEAEARREAMAAWIGKATRLGKGYASWRLATEKLIQCLPEKTGGFACFAKGMPCTIEQAPDRRQLRDNRIDI
jgi:hypothetical protein